ncbi:MAG TPA: hypothetical protein VF585_08710 [Chthoniobacterales bacterium]
MKRYVFIGFNGLFGDYADMVHANGGILTKVVVNLPLETVTGSRTFADQLASHRRWRERMGISEPLNIEALAEFQPKSDDLHILACRGRSVAPLRSYLRVSLGIRLEPLVHPTAILSPTLVLPDGAIIHSKVHVGADVVLGELVAIKTGCYIGHDSILGEGADLSPSVSLASGVKIEAYAQLGINSTVINGLTVGTGAIVAAGAVVTRDVAPWTMVAGVPAVLKKQLEPRPVPTIIPGLS